MIKKLNSTTKKAQQIINTFNSRYWDKGSIYEAYRNPSNAKINAYEGIQRRAWNTEGYNHDLRVTGASCHQFSTMYSFTDDEGTHIIYDTASNTFEVLV